MLQEFNEPDLSSMVIPEPDLSVLTSFERSLFGSYIRRCYYDQAVKHKDQMKRNLYYNGMKYTLGTYLARVLRSLFLPLYISYILVLSLFFAFVFVPATKPIVVDMWWYFGFPVGCVMSAFVVLTTPFSMSQIRTKNSHRDANGIPRDKRTKFEMRKTPDRYC